MPQFASSPAYEHGLPESLGVLIVNLGTPDAPTPAAVRRYLAEFLSDPRVVELPRILWWPILHGVILRTRPAKSAAAYREIWTDQGSPLLCHTRDIAGGIRDRLKPRLGGAVQVEVGMTYGHPSLGEALGRLHSQFARRILVLPLYPQYSGTTTGSVFDLVTRALARRRWVPELRFVNHYHDDARYIAALAASVRDHWAEHGRGEKLLMSFHGLPDRLLEAGDPYHCHCHKTARLLGDALALEPGAWQVSFQSRIGREQWLKPYTDKTLEAWAGEGLSNVDVICPGFPADCLETLEEIAMQNAKLFRSAGGAALRYVPALNAREDHLSFLAELVMQHLAGWPEAEPGHGSLDETAEREKSRARARALGATC